VAVEDLLKQEASDYKVIVLQYINDISRKVEKRDNVVIELSTSVEKLVLGWLEKNKLLNEELIQSVLEFENDFEKMLEAEVQLLKQNNKENKKYWLINKMKLLE